jgi:hypothetical protein
MFRRLAAILASAATVAILVAACNGGSNAPALTDPTAIVTAAVKSTEAAKSVHLDLAVDGKASVSMPGAAGAGTPVDLTGTTAAADVDFAGKAAKATFSVPVLFGFAGEVIAVDGKIYLKTTMTGPLYTESASTGSAVDPGNAGGLVGDLGDLLLKQGVTLVKGDDVACGSKQCYTVSADLTAEQLGATGIGALAGLPVNVAGATLKLTVRVEKDLPNHLAGVTAVITTPDGSAATVEVTASKWDEPVSVSAPPADQVKPAK